MCRYNPTVIIKIMDLLAAIEISKGRGAYIIHAIKKQRDYFSMSQKKRGWFTIFEEEKMYYFFFISSYFFERWTLLQIDRIPKLCRPQV